MEHIKARGEDEARENQARRKKEEEGNNISGASVLVAIPFLRFAS